MSDLHLYRRRAAEAARQAEAATSQTVRERCERFVIWWSVLADACEAGDFGRAAGLAVNVACLKSPDERSAAPRLVY